MELKVKKPSCTVGTLAMGTASNGPRAIPAALQVTKAASNTHQCQFSQLRLQNSNNQIVCSVLGFMRTVDNAWESEIGCDKEVEAVLAVHHHLHVGGCI